MWALHQQRLNSHAQDGSLDQVAKKNDTWGLFALMSYSYASLHVAIEGYQELKLTDPTIDELLKSDQKDNLKRYRNAVFHFQKQFLDDRFVNLILDQEHVKWASALRGALVDFVKRELATVTGTEDELFQFRDAVARVFTWAGWGV
jgi:hypothetical protein